MRCHTGIFDQVILGSNDENGNGTCPCKFDNLKEWKKIKIGFSNGIDATYDQIYHGYLVNMCKLMPKGR